MKAVLLATALGTALVAQQLPNGPGKAETEKLCKGCHELSRSISPRQDRAGWQRTLNKMAAFGMKSTENEYAAVLDYLAKHYPAETLPPVNLNKAPAIELESRLSVRRSQAAALIAWRSKHGPLKSLADLKKVPNLDLAPFEARKDRIVF